MRPAALFPTFPSVSCYQSAVVRTANEPNGLPQQSPTTEGSERMNAAPITSASGNVRLKAPAARRAGLVAFVPVLGEAT